MNEFNVQQFYFFRTDVSLTRIDRNVILIVEKLG